MVTSGPYRSTAPRRSAGRTSQPTPTSTIESTNFFRGLRSGRAQAVTRPLHVGRTTIVLQTDLTDDEGRRLAQVTQTQVVLAPSGT
ncbi:MAG TPA: hotdog domain-containing protein [Acidimicrobiales bacterium]|nr:hotdog domain-containing protein [Acidimicrobiales bacterium]